MTSSQAVSRELINPDLRPVAPLARTWGSGAYLALWVGMAINAATWTLASSLIAMGMNWFQAVFTIVLANLIILVPMLLNSHAGAKHGISFPVFVRSSFGIRGSNVPALLRALVGCGWAGIQTWLTALALDLALGVLFGSWWKEAPILSLGFIGEQRVTLWFCFVFCAVAQVWAIVRGFGAVKRLQQLSAPLISISLIILLVYLLFRSKGDLGPVVEQPSEVGWGRDFWLGVFPPGLMANIAFWATLSLNMPDFTRFAKDQKSQRRGQIIGLPLSMFAFSLIAVLVTSTAAAVFQVDPTSLWSPDALVATLGNPVVVVIGALIIVLANFSTNVAANMAGPALDMTNAFPKWINLRVGVCLVMLIGTCMFPWRLLSNPESYVFVWLGFYGGVTGAIGGVMVVDYWLLKNANLDVPALFTPGSKYWYRQGFNIKALLAFVIGAFFAVAGAYSPEVDGAKTGPFPVEGFIPIFKTLYDYNWVVSFGVGFAVYLLLNVTKLAKRGQEVTVPFRIEAEETREVSDRVPA
ncbi:NCS1 family nucleobase:cation symporter-1 [Corynebacterium flavescens]|uniref:NCS1 family nucleobase:cation symporter-1 n=1 Tax=Corynebacterium flavescens TaxID=28028 RepID=UPI0026484726|nr:NCS1 family nucleobase:cation symporter-1 [Corynebacterium flavescens]MDN6431785.1 NCS1 family nucleobase:cation symporter-1 [Corynebacterium flavescens]MDN6475705.1 NCS1 family nucleobase:cation symporter-1 [Corynebacterium flavescens]MDN6531910.1 NCS1 family nucleobase:cation symporter-1 [Corynebacterium flavescens]MDN6601746.1 NCS1 family nucleobase:cation symporter-1 [Corynebacterium flavescens]MDN6688037.1 NCS1 family nucleobase:cation symporter-1 [Corynebacterium flavescens]